MGVETAREADQVGNGVRRKNLQVFFPIYF